MPRFFDRLLAVLCLGALLFALPACDSDDPVDEIDDGPLAEAAANPGQWFFIETDGARCRDGSPTGFGVRFQEGSDDLMIYLEGGGACFNATTCEDNRASFDAGDFTGFVGARGDAAIFSTDNANPVGDWNMVYVPYCTGDAHGGSAPNVTLPDVAGAQQFVGHQNIQRYLDILGDAFDDPDDVLLTGISAGGLGSLVNFSEVAETFGSADLFLLDDSAPVFFADNVLSPQLIGQIVALYNVPAAFPSDADALFQPDGFQGIYDYYDDRYPDATFGISSYTEDQTFRFFYGFGQAPGDPITGEEYEAGLLDLRAMLPDSWGTYYVEGEAHTFLTSPDRYFGTFGGVALNVWLGDLLDGNATDVGPELVRAATR